MPACSAPPLSAQTRRARAPAACLVAALAAGLIAGAPAASAAPRGGRSGRKAAVARAGKHDSKPAARAGKHDDKPAARAGKRDRDKAEARPIAILSLELTGDAAPELKPQLERSLRAGLASRGARVISLAAVMGAIGSKPELLGCTSTTCLARIGGIVGARRFVAATIGADGAAYTIDLQLLSPDADGGLVRHLKDSCTVCTLSDLHARVKRTAAALISPAREPVAVVITTQPAGATLTVDGKPAGRAPYQGKLVPGRHQVVAALRGFVSTRKHIEISSSGDSPEKFMVILSAAPGLRENNPTVHTVRSGRRRYRTWKWLAGGGALAGLATGVALVAMDGQGTCSPSPPQTECRNVYDTKTAGLVTAGVGIGLAVASGWMFFRDRSPDERRVTAAIAPTPGGAAAALAIRF